jgi:hypothetical protein
MTRSQIGRIKTLFAMLGLGLWIGSGMLYFHYAKTRPEQPDPDPGTGRIYLYGQAGKDFYLNAAERRLWRCLVSAGITCFAVAVGSYLYERRLAAGASPQGGPTTPAG